jgi:acyl-[acyl-carrier-protein]-phospholipid O-acyltransferase/long-chain-fatty-acid--[acyl-carrier-protein] ligase
VILFTSGSTSRPKGVALSHYNILSNVAQIIATIGVGPGDVWFNALPMFHSFGLTVCTMCPFLVGAKLFLYPTPLHYRVIPELCYDIRATIMASTNTFLRNYAKYAHPYDFASMRLCINGGELLREDTRRVWNEKFGVRIIQGYGTTETSPVVTFNSPTFVRIGSIGKFVPGLEYRLEKLDGLANGGELYVRGDNVMMGYIDPDDPKKIIPPPDGWHETGDVVEVDDDGFVFITDRVKRFAKLAGEMVPLSGVEDLVKDAYNDDKDLDVGAVSVPDDMKGEKIVLVSTHQTVGHAAVANYAKIHGISERFVPKTYLYTDELPLLKTGKRDYVGLKRWVMDELGPKAQ